MSKSVTIEDPEPVFIPHWMVTFSDMRVLLLCFFIMIIGFSSAAKEDGDPAPGALSGQTQVSLGGQMESDSLLVRAPMTAGQVQLSGYDSTPEYGELNYVYQGLDIRNRASAAGNALQYKLTEKGFEIDIQAGTLFEEGAFEVSPAAFGILDLIGDAVRQVPHPLRVQACADELFVPTESCASEEQMALRRAAVVCRYLQQKGRVSVERLSLATEIRAGQTRADADRRSQVSIVVLPLPGNKTP